MKNDPLEFERRALYEAWRDFDPYVRLVAVCIVVVLLVRLIHG